MNVTIKTEILVKAWREFSFPHINCVSQLVPNEGEEPFFSLCHDHQKVILSEYEKVLGSVPAFRGWMAELEDDVNQWDTIESYGGTIQVMHFPLRGSFSESTQMYAEVLARRPAFAARLI